MKLYSSHNNRTFEIEEDLPDAGVYLYVYENGRCIADHLQADITACIDQAFEDYEVAKDSWTEIAP